MAQYRWLNELSQQFLDREYLQPGESLDERVDVICENAEQILKRKGFAKKFKGYLQKGWYSLATPVWTNFGNDRGLPISCFGSYIEDDTASILWTQAEVGMMSKMGGGTSAFFGNLRHRGAPIKGGRNGYSGGAVHFMQLFDTDVRVISQGSARRGSFAAYLPIEHPDIMEFLNIKGDGSPIQDISFGVTITDKFMNEMIAGDPQKRTVWAKVLEVRNNLGYPYLAFIDNINKGAPDVYKDNGLLITQSNLCTEVLLPTHKLWSFVCDLSSQNLLYYDEWKDTDATEVLVYFLDAVMTEFINKAKNIPFFDKAIRFAEENRALGLGQLGWHSYLQSKSIPYESMEAKRINLEIAKNIRKDAYTASAKMAEKYGVPPLLKKYGRRHATLQAIAPTTSSAFILGQVSQCHEPFRSNYYIKDLAKGKFTIKNPYLEQVLKGYNKNNDGVWHSILENSGSVQHLPFISAHDKNVFKTFREISPAEVIAQAAQRQPYIDQGQSLNLIIDPSTPVKDVNTLIINAWRSGVKTLYYQFNVNAAQEVARNILRCTSCEA
jgi:ribonucleoside-diphosphate reductase alpha chain